MDEDSVDPTLSVAAARPMFRSGFATLIGRPNVGKSTLVNQILGTKVSIVSDKVQTTRTQVRGIYNRVDAQIVFVDTPGIHRPRSLLGERSNEAATSTIGDVDVVCFVLDATMPFGKGDKFVAARAPKSALVVVNKIDQARREEVLAMLGESGEFGFSEYFPVSALTGDGVDVLREAIVSRMPEGPAYYPTDVLADVDETFWIGELVREQLLHITSEELPHSIACRVTEWEEREGKGPYVRVEVLVERESQRPIVIGRGGANVKAVGIAVREQLPPGAYLDIHVKVDRDWQRRAKSLDRLGY
jgi:GTPase